MASIDIRFAADTLSGTNVHASGAVLGEGTPGAQAVLLCNACKQFVDTRSIAPETFLALMTCTLTEPVRAGGGQ